MEFIEVKKALEKATLPAAKFRKELMEANRKLHEFIWSKTVDVPINSVSPTESINSNIPSGLWSKSNGNSGPQCNGGIDFQIGASTSFKDNFGNSMLCFGEGKHTKTLIDDNENLRIRYVVLCINTVLFWIISIKIIFPFIHTVSLV